MVSINQINNYSEFKLSTFQKILNSTTNEKIAFIFISILTAGILPLAILVYDISNAIISDIQFRGEFHVVKLKKNKINNLYNSVYSLINYKIVLLVAVAGLAVLFRDQINLSIVKPLMKTSYEKITSFFKDNKKEFFIGSTVLLGLLVVYKQAKKILSEDEETSTPIGKTERIRPPAYNPESNRPPAYNPGCKAAYPTLDPDGLNPRGEGQ
jgi:hypothetical protein